MRSAAYCRQYDALLCRYGLQVLPADCMRIVTFEKKEYLSREGCEIFSLYLIVSGTTAVTLQQKNGKSLLLSFCRQPALIGEVELCMARSSATTSTYAVSRVVCVGIDKAQAQACLMDNSHFLRTAACTLAHRLDRCGKNGALNILYALETRLCSYIDTISQKDLFSENLTSVSELLGTSYRHLLRVMLALCSRNILEKEADGYRIIDRQRLRELGCSFFLTDDREESPDVH